MKLPQIQSLFVAISGGMDLTTPPIVKANSEAIIALNVQPNYGGGFSRIEGYECLDGMTTPSLMNHFHVNVNHDVPQSAVGKQFLLNDRTCYVLAVNERCLTFAVSGQFEVDVGTTFDLDRQTYQTISKTFLNTGEVKQWQHYQALAFQAGVDNVQAVPGENALRGVVELNEQIIAFRDGENACEVFLATKTGWQSAPATYFVELKDISKPKEFIDGVKFTSGEKQGNVFSAVLSADDSSGHLVVNTALLPEAEIHINGSVAAKVKSCEAVRLTKEKAWTFIYHNFYGGTETAYAYGCNGEQVIEVRPDGIIVPIITQAENPQYIVAHRNHLFIAFSGGQFGHSLVGKPTHWAVLLGSEHFGVGDEITALSSTTGGVLLIGCRHKTTALYGSTRDDWVLKDIAKVGIKSGTLQATFIPIAISRHGIIRVDATEQFGDFKLSETDSGRKLGFKPIENNIVFSSTKAKSNQVRFYSENAFHICMMLQPDGSTKSTYFTYPEKLKGVWQSHHNTFLAFDDGKVYRQSDDCFSFAGKPIEWTVKMAFNHCGSPVHIKSWKSAELQATAQGVLSVQYRFDLDYNADFHAVNLARELSVIGHGGRWNESYWNDFLWSTQEYSTPVLYLSGYSRNLSLSFAGSDLYAPQFELSGLVLNYILRRFHRV
ncbi:hypothetical protein E3U35_03060 [Histophilus somni]|uniref:hypothetical protein n=1 Tax=Histophilus somni TaxID=731 RepID=UPI001044C6EE|nr:hypothetical protein [Histophilus somni]QEH09355.1 hypothetical protein FWK43_07630 [Histophilus somni]QEH11990.1 hypothetical protein FWK44_02155 [Histophilus somni]QQF66097.1 hypothetical protein JFL60_02135 [Histophilus somni]QQF70840.1 hypothetical protein JFL59_02135 [Histophilus somni]QQF72684.1 hypothetical protein JFL50_02170 [Histophilus somni]